MILCHLKMARNCSYLNLGKNHELCTTGTGLLGKLDHLYRYDIK